MSRKTKSSDGGVLPEGTVIAIPIDSTRWAIGQVLEEGVLFYLGVDPTPLEEVSTDACITNFKPAIFAMTSDGEIYKGKWKVIGKHPISIGTYPRPNYKVYRDGKLVVVNFDGEVLSDFVPSEDDHLQFRSNQSPLLIQDAVQALAGAGEWLPYYEKLIPAD